MNPEDRIRMLMEENAMLRAKLGSVQAEDQQFIDPAPHRERQRKYGYFRQETEQERLDKEAGDLMPPEYYDTYKPPQTMEYRNGMYPEGPLLKKMPKKSGEGGGPLIRKL